MNLHDTNRIWDAVIFDFDGVIVDSEPIHYQAFEGALAPLGIQHSYEQYVERYVGFNDRDGFLKALRSSGAVFDDNRVTRLIADKSRFFKEIVARGVTPFPATVELIQTLAAQRMPLAIASGSHRADIEAMLVSIGIRAHFPIVATADDVTRSKPDPETYLLAFERLREQYPNRIEKPERCLVIEDTPAGIEAAKEAGLSVLAVTHSYGAERLARADMVIQDPDRLDLPTLERETSQLYGSI